MELAELLLALGALGVLVGVVGVARTLRLTRKGIRAEAVVAEMRRVRLGPAGKGARQLGFEPIYEFRDMEGVTHQMTGKVRTRGLPAIGSTRKVHYPPGKPGHAVFSGGRQWAGPFAFLLVSVSVCGVAAYLLPGA